VDHEAGIVTLWRGSLEATVVPFSAFPATANGIRPNWNAFTVADYDHTLRFGDYEAATDSILYDFDREFRRRQNKLRTASEQTLGASIRRLRKQRQLTRNDSPSLDPRTLAREPRRMPVHSNEGLFGHADGAVWPPTVPGRRRAGARRTENQTRSAWHLQDRTHPSCYPATGRRPLEAGVSPRPDRPGVLAGPATGIAPRRRGLIHSRPTGVRSH